MDQKILDAINTKLKSDFKLIKQFYSGIANLNYLLQNSKNEKIVARILKEQKPENIAFEALVQSKLNKARIGSPLLLKDDNKPILLKVDTNKITFSNYIEADPNPKTFPNSLLEDLGELIARFQLANSTIPTKEVPENYLSAGYQDNLKFRDKDKKTAKEIRVHIDKLYTEISKLNLPQSIIHGDLNEGNILIKDKKIIAILDLETVEYKQRILDLGIVIYYRQPESGLTYPEVSRLIISGFEKREKLTREEKSSIPLAVRYTAACFSLWSLANEETNDKYDFLESFQELQKRIEEGFK